MVEDGENPDAPDAGWFAAPAGVRRRLGLTQPQMAGLLRILWREPEAARRALGERAA
jgi:hypothetical protein